METILKFIGIYVIISGFLDAYKYHWQSQTIRKMGTAKGHSRKFINAALHNDIVKLVYLFVSGITYRRFDWFLILTSIIACFYMIELFVTIYLYYPYRCRKLNNFKRPNIFVYTINSLLPNKIRKRL